jgi:outer membrane protein TolC
MTPAFSKSTFSLLLMLALSGCAVTTSPISASETVDLITSERSELVKDQEGLSGPLTLNEAMARALKYNLDFRVKTMEEALSQRQFDLSKSDLLPKLTLQAGYSSRDNENASSSKNVSTGAQSLVPSTSQDTSRSSVDLGLTWNVLDFGVSYYQAQQQSDRVLAAQERRRKSVHLVMQQVRPAYWQAVGAQVLEKKVQEVLADARKALLDSRRIESEKLISPFETLSYQRQLLELIRQLEAINDELAQAKPRLASLMNMEPGRNFVLQAPVGLETPKLAVSMERMEETALMKRPELMEARYNERISVTEARKAIAKLYPGVEFYAGPHYDSNSFLVNNNWRDAGLRVSWNLFNILNASAIKQTAEAQKELASKQRLALSMAVLTQTHVAFREYKGKLNQFELSDELDGVEQKLLGYAKNATRSDYQGKLQEVRASASALMSELRKYQSYGALQGAYGQVLATLGLDPLPETINSHDLNAVRDAVASMESRWASELAGKP